MPKFAFIYRGGRPPEDGPAHMEEWKAWAAGLGDAMVYPGMPFAQAATVSGEGVTEGSGEVPMTGLSVVEAESFEVAKEYARTCPHMDLGGDIVVAEGVDIEM